jgi:hypothetical protein
MATLRFITDLGAEVFVRVEGRNALEVRQAVLQTQREFGRMGWRSGDVPSGGFRFPLADEMNFDWSLIGGRRGSITVEGEERQGVWYDGHFYTRRELEPNGRMKLGEAVKYSRGAKNTDPPEIVEEGDGSFRYVTLAVFRGKGGRRAEYCVPSRGAKSTSRANGTNGAPAAGAGAR